MFMVCDVSICLQISTIQFENMRPIGMGLLSTIMDKVRYCEMQTLQILHGILFSVVGPELWGQKNSCKYHIGRFMFMEKGYKVQI